MVRLYEECMFQLGRAFRKTLNTNRYPWSYWVRIAYYDALSYNPATK